MYFFNKESKYVLDAQNLADDLLSPNPNIKNIFQKINNLPSKITTVFLNHLHKKSNQITDEVFEHIKNKLVINKSSNLQFIFYKLCLDLKKDVFLNEIKNFLQANGRKLYVRTLYKLLYNYSKDEAASTYEKNK